MSERLQGSAVDEAVKAERARILALIRAQAESRDYATYCSWLALADIIEHEA